MSNKINIIKLELGNDVTVSQVELALRKAKLNVKIQNKIESKKIFRVPTKRPINQ